jgi:hypothetical protein
MPRGRPRNTFLSDPDRYLLALAYVFREMGVSRRGSIEMAVACLEGVVTGRNPKPGWGRGMGMLVVNYQLRDRPHDLDGIANGARWLRRKMEAGVADAANHRWLAAMSGAWLIALHHGSARLIRDLAGMVREAEYAESVLVPVATGQAARLGEKQPKKVRN